LYALREDENVDETIRRAQDQCEAPELRAQAVDQLVDAIERVSNLCVREAQGKGAGSALAARILAVFGA
jgi:hypothetical protein